MTTRGLEFIFPMSPARVEDGLSGYRIATVSRLPDQSRWTMLEILFEAAQKNIGGHIACRYFYNHPLVQLNSSTALHWNYPKSFYSPTTRLIWDEIIDGFCQSNDLFGTH